jgi:hypothetical protein
MSFSLQKETLLSLELALDLSPVYDGLSPVFDGLSLTLKNQQLHHHLLPGLFSVVDRLLRSPTGRFFGVFKFDAFKARSTPHHQSPAETRPSSSITVDPASWRLALCLLPMSTRRRVNHTLLRVDLTRLCVDPTRRADHHRRPPPPVQPLFFEFMLLLFVTYCFPLLICILDILNRMGLFGVIFFLFFLVSVWKPLFPVTLHLNLHGFLGSLFRCVNGVFELPMVHSITSMRRGKSLLGLHSHLFFSLYDLISPLRSVRFGFLMCLLLCNLFFDI